MWISTEEPADITEVSTVNVLQGLSAAINGKRH